ncbi:MAG TPA: hypothetical protein VKE98_24415 [Gemmataceae bacterium]|nr:hypothetical protein [Gemmataceae bacterium]
MNQNLSMLADRIREQFPHLDVRTDQCKIVRVYAKGVLVGIKRENNKFMAQFISLNKCDFETPIVKSVSASDYGDFEVDVLKALVDLR